MHVAMKKIGWLPAVLPVIFACSLFGSPAHAEDARVFGHKLIREKILHDGHGRYDVKFTTTNLMHNGKRWLRMSGMGTFRKRDKKLQTFTYHGLIDPGSHISTNVGYQVR